MTIAELAESLAALPIKKQRQVLALAQKIRRPAARPVSHPSKERVREVNGALRAIAGMWKDRTDLPKDSVAASKILRRRLMGRKPDA